MCGGVLVMDDIALAIVERFGMLEDPRTGHARRHELLDIIVITLCAVICGADNWVEIEEFGKAKEDWFRRFLRFAQRDTLPRHLWQGVQSAGPGSVCGLFHGLGTFGQGTVPGGGGGHRWEDTARLS